eukprot:1157822-Pelagomonas_calceolata.AAC.23
MHRLYAVVVWQAYVHFLCLPCLSKLLCIRHQHALHRKPGSACWILHAGAGASLPGIGTPPPQQQQQHHQLMAAAAMLMQQQQRQSTPGLPQGMFPGLPGFKPQQVRTLFLAYTCMHARTRTHIHACTDTRVQRARAHAHAHMHTHIHNHKYTHTHTPRAPRPLALSTSMAVGALRCHSRSLPSGALCCGKD